MLTPASGTGQFYARSAKTIRFTRKGCTNRPFYHIVVTETRRNQDMPVIEQLGTYDPLPNQHNEKLVSLNLERIYYWLGKGAVASKPVEQLLGLSGFLPIHPTSYMQAWRTRQSLSALKETSPEAGEEQKTAENAS